MDNWQEFRQSMDSLKPEIQKVTCTNVSEKKQLLAKIRETLSNEQAECALSSDKYHGLVNELYQSLLQQGCLFPRKLGDILTFFDELVMHAMVVGNTFVLDRWGINPLRDKSVKAVLGEPKDHFIAFFEEKAKTTPAMAERYYTHLAEEFKSKLKD
jgi:hypothetical protein